MYDNLKKINQRPAPFEFYTVETLWNDEHISRQMLKYHLDNETPLASRKWDFIDESVEWMTERFNIGKGTKICDFGCGPGLYATRLAEKDADITGVDFSLRSIEHARKTAAEKNLRIEYMNENYLEFTTDKKFDLITMIYCDFCALSPGQRQTMLKKFHELLEDDGAVLLDVFSLITFEEKGEEAMYDHNLMGGFWSSEDYYGFLNSWKYEEEKVILDKYVIFEPKRNWEVYNWLQFFSLESLTKEFEDCGFRIEETFSDICGKPFYEDAPEFAVVGRKI